MQKLKIRGGTAQTKEDLCKTCTNRRYIKGFNNVEVKDCNVITFPKDSGWPFEVSECSQYMNTKFIPLYQLTEIAWHITPEVKERAGFKNPSINVKVVKPGDKEHNDNLGDFD
jgi:hypothetical protein